NVNLEYKSANKALTTELDRYKEEVKDLKEKQNVENSFSGSNEQFAEIVWICQISQEISQKRTRERMSDQEAKEIKAEAREIMPQPSTVNQSPSSIVL
ncbi:hypothetical protein Tco_0082430, partial [Tanacetum coccineum]